MKTLKALLLSLIATSAFAGTAVNQGDSSVTVGSVTITGAGIVIGGVLQSAAYTGGGGGGSGGGVIAGTGNIGNVPSVSVASSNTLTMTGSLNAFSSSVTVPAPLGLSVTYGITASTFNGNGAALTNLTGANVTGNISGNAANISGNLPVAQLSGNLPATQIAAGTLPVLNGSNLTNLTGANVGSGVPAANIAAGSLGSSVIASSVATSSVGIGQLNFSGTPSASTFARGDGSWAAPSGGGGTSGTVVSANQFSAGYYNVAGSSNSIAAFSGVTLSTNTGVSITTYTVLGGSFAVLHTSNTIMTGTTFYQDGSIATSLTVSLPVQTTVSGKLNAAAINLSGAQVTGSLPAASIASGSLGASVLASSISANSVYPAAVQSGSYPNITGVGTLTNAVLVTPNLGTPSAIVLTNASGTAASLTAGNVTTNANLTGPVTSAGNATSIASSIALPGSPTTTTQSTADNSTKLATTAFVQSQFPLSATNGGLGINNSAATGFVTFSAGVSTVTQICAVVATDTATATNTNYFNAGGLVLSVAANKQYLLMGTFHFTGGGAGGSKLKIFGNGASENYDVSAWSSYNSGALSSYNSGVFSPITDTTTDDITLQGSVNMQTLTNLNVQFAQNSSNASALTLKAGSYFCAFPIN